MKKRMSELITLTDNQIGLPISKYVTSNLNIFLHAGMSEPGSMSLTDDQVGLADHRGFKSLSQRKRPFWVIK